MEQRTLDDEEEFLARLGEFDKGYEIRVKTLNGINEAYLIVKPGESGKIVDMQAAENAYHLTVEWISVPPVRKQHSSRKNDLDDLVISSIQLPTDSIQLEIPGLYNKN